MTAGKAAQPPSASRPRRARKPAGPDRLQELPLELLLLTASYLDLPALLSLTLVSKSLRALLLEDDCHALWLSAIEGADLPELEAPLRPVEYASLVFGKRCRVCGKMNGRKVEFHLRTRLCAPCWDDQLVYEGPDEPDPAFEDFFPGTKRYTPRSPFFFLWMLESTSDYLSHLFIPQITAFESALEHDPLAELDDFLAFSALPAPLRRELDDRAEWVKRCWRDGEALGAWEAEAKRRRRQEMKRLRTEGADEAKAIAASLREQ
ncbi:hypothetical protein JCM8202_003667 [Rhodotorula sphaerocarpa]